MKKIKTVKESDDINLTMAQIGSKVREIRMQKNPNYEAWAYLNNINKVSLNRCETGENMTMKLLITILRKLDTPLDQFFAGIK